MTTTGDRIYPFTGIVGMADLKLALLLNAVSPAIGGVLVRGEKGTASRPWSAGWPRCCRRCRWYPAARTPATPPPLIPRARPDRTPPLLRGKGRDPGVVCVDEALRFAVPVLGALDEFGADLGFTIEPGSDLAGVGTAILSGKRVTFTADQPWPLPALPPNVVRTDRPEPGIPAVLVTDKKDLETERAVVFRPPSLIVGAGASRGVPAAEIGQLIDSTLAELGLSPRSVRHLATAEVKADEDGLQAAAAERGWRVVTHPAEQLAAVPVPNPSEVVRRAIGTPSVAEAAALIDPGATLLAAKRASALRPGTKVLASGLGAEQQRAAAAVAQARAGHAVALIGSGDAGVYAMGSPALELAGDDIDVTVVPGVTAALAVAAVLGAPLGHDHVMISLSDLHTAWPVIERRIIAAAEADLVTCFYNPASARRGWQLRRAIELLAARRPPATPVGWVRDATRPGQAASVATLADFDPGLVDMHTLVVVGSSRSRVRGGRMVTPRDYRWAPLEEI